MSPMDEAGKSRLVVTRRHDAAFREALGRELLTKELLGLPEMLSGLAGAVAKQGALREDVLELPGARTGQVQAGVGETKRPLAS